MVISAMGRDGEARILGKNLHQENANPPHAAVYMETIRRKGQRKRAKKLILGLFGERPDNT